VGEASIQWDQSPVRRDQIGVKLLSPPLPVASELMDAGRAVIPDAAIGLMLSRDLLAPHHVARHVPQSCAVVRQVAPSSALMRGRKS
jgi:hypothetical protein